MFRGYDCGLAIVLLLIAGCAPYFPPIRTCEDLRRGYDNLRFHKALASARDSSGKCAGAVSWGYSNATDAINSALSDCQIRAYKDGIAEECRVTKVGNRTMPHVPPIASPRAPVSPPQRHRTKPILNKAGTGFFVNADGVIVTNYHVIEGCESIEANGVVATVVAVDPRNDLAAIKIPSARGEHVSLRNRPPLNLGESVIVLGFPLRERLASNAKVTNGIVSSLAGPGKDSRIIQITAPIQPGNSGGPLLDHSGNLIGVIVSTLDAIGVAADTGSIPQNVNFAISGDILRRFLLSNRIHFIETETRTKREISDIAETAIDYITPIECMS